ncbi:hypothetical protein F4677DRAFT_446779 [Hypoxylon crocopeplum]|nr:hypothetical protein F4677DRAFT_446779 [Hypoxylon crocopeplum]
MAHPRCLAYSSPARALHRVLVSDLSSSSRSSNSGLTTSSSSYYLFPPRLFSSLSSSSRRLLLTSRPLPPTPTVTPIPRHVRPLTTTPTLRRVDAPKVRLTNNKIPSKWVRVVQPPPSNTLGPARHIDDVLAELNLKTHTLVMLAARPAVPPEDQRGDDFWQHRNPPAAICRVVDNAAVQAKATEAARGARRKVVNTKELELSWGIAGHDLEHKLRRLRTFLEKGMHVEVVLAKKRRGRAAPPEQAEAVLAQVHEAVASVEGAKESRKMDGSVGGVLHLFFEGPTGNKKVKKKQQEVEEEDD